MISLVRAGSLAIFLLSCAGLARADPRLDEKVYDPYVHNGVFELEIRGARANGGPLGGSATGVWELEYGLSDRVSLALVGALSREPGGSAKGKFIGLESVVYVGQIPNLGIDTGLYFEYGHGLGGETDFLEGKLLFAKTVGRFQGLLNLIVEEPLGAPAGQDFASYGYAASATLRTMGKLRLGAEAVGNFGNDHAFGGRQGAYVGPQVKWQGRLGRSPVELELDAGWLAAVGTFTNEASSQVRFVVELERRF